ncbi:DUF2871 family protein [Mogibacterium pumilum]|uniref:DUF2871 family protein n=1 Tax=Mogibacterium pumilum TaxID=86332 RepID=UPI002693D276|nr:DUF2871 family protein [Mogibacterium pumilum]
MKRYMNSALAYAILAMIGGVFYREFTKYHGFSGKTYLSVVHTHYFLLGMVFFILLLLLEKNFAFTTAKTHRAKCLNLRHGRNRIYAVNSEHGNHATTD